MYIPAGKGYEYMYEICVNSREFKITEFKIARFSDPCNLYGFCSTFLKIDT